MRTIDPSPRSLAWGWPPLPEWVSSFRPSQLDAVAQIAEHFDSGRKVVFLDAPTGTGKTLIGEMVRRLVSRRALYTCTTRTLQDQFEHDFRYASVLKGRANYPTADEHGAFYAREHWARITAADCTKGEQEEMPVPGCTGCEKYDATGFGRHCLYCHPWTSCPYEKAKAALLDPKSIVGVTNLAYLLTEMNGPGRLSAWDEPSKTTKSYPFPLFIVDEADELESGLMGHTEVSLNKTLVKRLGISPPDRKTLEAAMKTGAWREWALSEGLPKLKDEVERLSLKAAARPEDRSTQRELKALSQHYSRLDRVAETLGEGWVYMDYETGAITFKPVRVDSMAAELLWRHSERFLLMSATIISPQQMAQDLGLAPQDWAAVSVPSSFPPTNRPIFVRGAANMTFREKEAEWPRMAAAVARIVDLYPGQRILVHTVSYALSKFLEEQLRPRFGRRIVSYANATERDSAIDAYLRAPDSVMLAASLERGIDLAYDKCRAIIIAKVPFPNLQDKQVNARLYSPGGQSWYAMLTVRSMVQMSGRGMRHEDDQCDTWILDRQFTDNIWSKNRSLFPGWWREAIDPYPERRFPGRSLTF